ncbi:MAG: DUF63 family protein [Candidatus Aenigmarchaeota archaeon]|nr:DUF63 family protein [Candidatus Aenigmarchaeota archaeon]
MDFISDFISRYFLIPMGHYYTLPGTIAYAIFFVIAVLLVYKYILKKLKIKIDANFMLSLLPFIILGGVMRSLEDAEFYQSYFFVSPVIYITLFFIALSSLLFSVLAEKYIKMPYWQFMITIGSAILLYNIIQVLLIGIVNLTGFFMVAGLILMWAIIFLPVTLYFTKYLSRLNYFILLSHLLDASSTFVATTFFSYHEQHVIPSLLFPIFGSWIMFPLKIAVVWPILYLIDNNIKDKEFVIWLKIAILILGLALGVRDLLSLSMLA